MPVILPKENERKWIDEKLLKEDIQKLMVPFDENLMGHHTISKLITSRTENSNVEKVK
ncbi:MAG: SOS response-associated peptidase, partial [Bacteroidetes bacterium]|nr:SOS response-associated peptidase [Bacteroidota bacterium]